jgi:hypothetical protein
MFQPQEELIQLELQDFRIISHASIIYSIIHISNFKVYSGSFNGKWDSYYTNDNKKGFRSLFRVLLKEVCNKGSNVKELIEAITYDIKNLNYDLEIMNDTSKFKIKLLLNKTISSPIASNQTDSCTQGTLIGIIILTINNCKSNIKFYISLMCNKVNDTKMLFNNIIKDIWTKRNIKITIEELDNYDIGLGYDINNKLEDSCKSKLTNQILNIKLSISLMCVKELSLISSVTYYTTRGNEC